MKNIKTIKPKRTILDDYEGYLFDRKFSECMTLARSIRPLKCPKCDLYGCICQTGLNEFTKPVPRYQKNLCPICQLFLCDCPEDAYGNRIKTL